jgi:hypothetical protein
MEKKSGESLADCRRGYIPGMGDEQRPVWPWIVALLIGLPVLYVLSFGPACWISSRLGRAEEVVFFIYEPVIPELVMCGLNYGTVRSYGELLESESYPVARDVLSRALPHETFAPTPRGQ